MKKFLSLVIAVTFLLMKLHAGYRDTTIEVAEDMKFPQFLYDFRGKVNDFLTQTQISMDLDVADLAAKNLFNRADELQAEDEDTYDAMSARFDAVFDRLSEHLDFLANRLDEEGATKTEKGQVVLALEKEAKDEINALFKSRGYVAPARTHFMPWAKQMLKGNLKERRLTSD